MTTRSALIGLLLEAGEEFVESRRRVLINILTVSLASLHKFYDLALVYFSSMYSDPETDDHFEPAEARGAIKHFHIVRNNNGIFTEVTQYNRLAFLALLSYVKNGELLFYSTSRDKNRSLGPSNPKSWSDHRTNFLIRVYLTHL